MSFYDKYKEERILINQDGSHNKFWAAHWDEQNDEVHVRWGRIGCSGQSQVKKMSKHEAVRFIESKSQEKRRKGYLDKYDNAPIDRSVLDKLAIEAAIVGTQNKCHGMQWVEITDPDAGYFEAIQESRLYDPDCNPGVLVKLETRKEYDGETKFKLLFSFDRCFRVSHSNINNPGVTVQITENSDLYKMVQKVEEAIGRSLS